MSQEDAEKATGLAPQTQDIPDILFFSGGSALRDTSRRLKRHTQRTLHLMTPFDSGGSSAELRRAFDMPAVGDLRNRLLALADEEAADWPVLGPLLSHRLDRQLSPQALQQELAGLAAGSDKRLAALSADIRQDLVAAFACFQHHMPADFQLPGASLGNLAITGRYLETGRDLEQAVTWFASLLQARGQVRISVDATLHLRARLADNTVVFMQHLLSGKDASPISSPVQRLALARSEADPEDVVVDLPSANAALIRQARLICYPPASFFTSLCANLLPRGTVQAIAANPACKVYAPGLGHDPECFGMGLADRVEKLLQQLQAHEMDPLPSSRLLSHMLLDEGQLSGLSRGERWRIESQGITILPATLADPGQTDRYDPEVLSLELMRLVQTAGRP